MFLIKTNRFELKTRKQFVYINIGVKVWLEKKKSKPYYYKYDFLSLLVITGLFLSLLSLSQKYEQKRIWRIGQIKSPVKIPIRHMWAWSNGQKNPNSVRKIVTKFIKRLHYTGFYYEEKPYQQPNQENNINVTEPLNTSIFESNAFNLANKQKQDELLKNNVKPFALSKDQILTPWKTIPHPTMVHNSIINSMPYVKNIGDMEIPPVVITHKIPTKALQQKNNFVVIASVDLSPDKENKPQYAILTDRRRTLADMIKSGYNEKITEWFINSPDIKINKANMKRITYLYEIFGIKHNLIKNQLKVKFYANRTLVHLHMTLNSGLSPMDLDLVSRKHLKLLLKITKIDKSTLLVKSTFTTGNLSSTKKETLQLEGKTQNINVNKTQHTTATTYIDNIKTKTKKVKTPKSKNQNVDDHLEKSKKTHTPVIYNGRVVRRKNGSLMRSSYKPTKTKSTSQTGQSKPKNKITEINDDDDIDI